MTDRQYKFSWDLLGDIALGRPNLGASTSLEVYRLMQFTFRDVMEQHLGTEKTNQIFNKFICVDVVDSDFGTCRRQSGQS